MFELLKLPFEKDSLAPYISSKTLEYHYGKHHRTYVENLNVLIQGTEYESYTLEKIVKNSNGFIFNNSAQIWNHNFYWNSLSSINKKRPQGKLLCAIEKKFGNFSLFKSEFSKLALTSFGSSWIWLVKGFNGVDILSTSNADCPIVDNIVPLLVCDVWEHAYYIDYYNSRDRYIDNFWNIINWDIISFRYIAYDFNS